MNTVNLEERDMAVFEEVLASRAHWFGRDDIHGNFNAPKGHAVGLWGEIGLWRWMCANDLPVTWSGRCSDSLPDFMAFGKIGIEAKAQQPHNWTAELATTVQKRSMINWRRKASNRYVMWVVTQDPREHRLCPVTIMGWDVIEALEALGTKIIRETQQYQSYPNHQTDLGGFIERLRIDARA